MTRKTLWAAAGLVAALAAADCPAQQTAAAHTLWAIGKDDDAAGEFALAPGGYARFLQEDFGWPERCFVVGRSRAERDWPYVLPGPADAWAGSSGAAGARTQVLNILFELERCPEGAPFRLVIDLVDVQTGKAPLLKVWVNDRVWERRLAPGASEESIKGHPERGAEQLVAIELAAGVLHRGCNHIQLSTIQGSWMIFDQVRLEGPARAALAPPQGTLIRSVKCADYEIEVAGRRAQPLLVDVQQLEPRATLLVRLDGREILAHQLEPGRAVLEAPMPAVAKAGTGRWEILVDGAPRAAGRLERAPHELATAADYVDPFLGTAHSRWMIAPGPWMPFGMVKLAPENQDPGWQGGYDPHIENIAGFSHIHEWTMAGLLLMPTTGPLRTEPGPQYEPERGYRSRIDKRRERARIGYYGVFLEDYGIEAELSATTRAALQRYRFPPARQARVLIDLLFPAEYRYSIRSSRIRRVSATRLEGFSEQSSPRVWGAASQDYTVHFAIEFNRPMSAFGRWKEGAWAEFDARAGLELEVRSAISLAGIEQAALNLRKEISEPFAWDFDAVVRSQRRAWNELLERIRIETPDRREKVRFYTNFYRALCARNIWSDVDGTWVDHAERVRRLEDPASPVLGCDAFWNTFWNLNQLWNLITPEWSARWARSELAMYDAGGWLARGPAGMEYIPVMVAEHEIPLLVGAWQMGVRDFDGRKALEAMVHQQTTPPVSDLGGGAAGNRHLEAYLKYGYIPQGMGLTSNTLEYAYDDWCVAQLAAALGEKDIERRFLERSKSWRAIIDRASGFARPRKADGTWVEPFDPFHSKGFTEGNAWQYTWFVPQDPAGLVAHLGRQRFVRELERGFQASYALRFNAPNERYGQYPVCHGNQPSMQVAFLFNHAGEPALTQKWTRAILERYYGHGTGDAYLGDEDQGQMSAWFIMAALGLFQMDGGCAREPIYEIASPLYTRAVLDLGGRYGRGRRFVIRARGASRANRYVQSARLNGKPLESWWFPAAELLRGGELVLEMGPEPSPSWGRAAPPPGAHR